jgi:xylulokinase
LPYLSGERTPHDDPHARGVFFGLADATSRTDIARAAMEGVAYSLADARDCVEAGAEPLGEVGLIGGGAKSLLWTRMIAAALERTIIRYRDGETGPAFGAARLARLARTGEAAEDLCQPPPVADVTAPEPALVAAFRPRIERFRSLYRALAPEFRASGEQI